MTVVLKQLPHERVVVRKRAATCLGSVAVVVSESLLNRLAVHLLQKISESPPPDVVRTLIQVIFAVTDSLESNLSKVTYLLYIPYNHEICRVYGRPQVARHGNERCPVAWRVSVGH